MGSGSATTAPPISHVACSAVTSDLLVGPMTATCEPAPDAACLQRVPQPHGRRRGASRPLDAVDAGVAGGGADERDCPLAVGGRLHRAR